MIVNIFAMDPYPERGRIICASYLDKTSFSSSSVHVRPKFAIKSVEQGGISLEDLSRPSCNNNAILSQASTMSSKALSKKHNNKSVHTNPNPPTS